MKAVRFYGVKDIRLEDIPTVQSTPQQALIKIIYGGVCGSDLHIYREGMFMDKIPQTMGHEFVGRIESVPAGTSFKKGDLVIGDPRVPCNKCVACQEGDFHRCSELGYIGEVSPGGFAEYLAIEPNKLIRLNDDINIQQAALAEPLAVAVHACSNIVASNSKRVLVAGAGPIGLLITYLLKSKYGLKEVAIADIDKLRLQKAKFAGADKMITLISSTANEYDCIVDAVGSPIVLNEALAAVAPGGNIHISAVYEKLPTLDVNLIVGKEIMLRGNNSYSFKDLEEAAEIINSKIYDFSWLISRILPVEQATEAFAFLTQKEKTDLKILIDFQ